MENQREHHNSEEEKKNVMLKYLKVIILQNPFYNYFQYGNKVNSILTELEKTELPKVVEKQNNIAKIQFKSNIESTLGILLSGFFLYKIRRISFLNRCFLVAVFYTAFLHIVELRKKDQILDNILFSMTHYGQEARILTKYYIPNHRKIVGIQNCMEIFRENSEKKHIELIKKRELVEGIIEKEKIEDQKFMDEVSKDFENEDFGKD